MAEHQTEVRTWQEVYGRKGQKGYSGVRDVHQAKCLPCKWYGQVKDERPQAEKEAWEHERK